MDVLKQFDEGTRNGSSADQGSVNGNELDQFAHVRPTRYGSRRNQNEGNAQNVLLNEAEKARLLQFESTPITMPSPFAAFKMSAPLQNVNSNRGLSEEAKPAECYAESVKVEEIKTYTRKQMISLSTSKNSLTDPLVDTSFIKSMEPDIPAYCFPAKSAYERKIDVLAAELCRPQASIIEIIKQGGQGKRLSSREISVTSSNVVSERKEAEAHQMVTSSHRLHHEWTLWLSVRDDGRMSSADRLRQVSCVESIEQFWTLFAFVIRPTELPLMGGYYFFKDGISPTCNDQKNADGGRLSITLSKPHAKKLRSYWLRAQVAVAGEQFGEYSNQICGVAVDVGKESDQIALWISKSSASLDILEIGNIFKILLNISEAEEIIYENHQSE